MSPAEQRAVKMRNASLLLAAYLGARRTRTASEAYITALSWVAAYTDYLAACSTPK